MDVMPGYKQTEVGVIPEDWNAEALGPHVEIKSGESPSLYCFESDGIPYFKVEQLNNNSKYLRDTSYFIRGNKKVARGSVIFPKRGASILLNKIRILESDSFMDTNLMTLTPNASVHPEFLYYALTHIELWRIADTTSIPQINNKHIIPLVVALPPTKAEQEAIAEALNDADALIESLEQLIAKKRDIKQAAMQQLLTCQTRLPGFHGDWVVKTLGETCVFENGDRGTNYPSPASFVHSGITFVNAGHVAEGRINHDAMDYITKESYDRLGSGKFKSGDILFCLRGSLGKFGIVGPDFGEGAIASSLVIVRPKLGAVTREHLGCYFNSALCAQMIEKWSGGAAQPNLGAQDLARFVIPLPPLPEQTAIAAVFSDMDAEIAALEAKLSKARQIKQGMMHNLLTGRIRLI